MMGRWSWVAAATIVGLLFAGFAAAESTADRIRRNGMLQCAAVERPGYAEVKEDKPSGRAAELCRTVAEAVLGRSGRFALRLLDLDSDFERVRRGEIELVFLEPRTVAEHHLGSVLISLGEAFDDRFAVMLPQSAAPQTLADLHGQTICFMIGDPVWPLLASDLGTRGVVFRPFGFSEEVEMKDAYNVGRCGAMAGLASTLDELRQDEGVKRLRSRLLAESLGSDRVMSMVSSGDPAWESTIRAILDGSGVGRPGPLP